MEKQRASFEEVAFIHRLPEDILLDIFHRVADLKSLCLCSLVSKHFASVISHVRTINITLPSSETQSKESCQRMFMLFRKIRYLKSEQIPAYLDMLSFQKLKVAVFLEKFRKLESVHLEYNSTSNSSLIMWKVKCNSHTAMIDNLVALFPASVHNKTEYELDQEQLSQETNGTRLQDCFWLTFGCYTEWLCIICMLSKSHSSLQSVTVSDSDSVKHCRLVIKNEQLVNLRSSCEGKCEVSGIDYRFKFARIPLLHLPLSGYIMRGVYLMMVKAPRESCASGEDDDIMGMDFEEHEKVFGEAVKEILKNYRDKIEIF